MIIKIKKFSDEKKSEKSKNIKSLAASGAIFGIGRGYSKRSDKQFREILLDDFGSDKLREENKKLFDNIAEEAKKQGTSVRIITNARHKKMEK